MVGTTTTGATAANPRSRVTAAGAAGITVIRAFTAPAAATANGRYSTGPIKINGTGILTGTTRRVIVRTGTGTAGTAIPPNTGPGAAAAARAHIGFRTRRVTTISGEAAICRYGAGPFNR